MKKLLSLLLTATLCVSFVPLVSAEEGALPGDYQFVNEAEKDFVENVLRNRGYNEYNDTSVFEGRKTYLIQDNFVECGNSVYQGQAGSQAMPAGWDVDRRAGGIRTDNQVLYLYDASNDYRTYMSHDLMPHRSGNLTLETGFTMKSTYRDGLFFEISGEGKSILKLVTNGQNVCYETASGSLVSIATYLPEQVLPIKAILNPEKQTADVIIGNVLKEGIPFKNKVSQIDNVAIGTPENGQVYALIPCVHVYVNYIVNERFNTTSIGETPYDFTLSHTGTKGIGVVATQAQRGEVNSYQMTNSGILDVPELTKRFETDNKKLVTEFAMLVPKKVNGIKGSVLSGKNEVMSISTSSENFVLPDGTVLYKDYYENFWYRFKIVTDTDKGIADIYVNFQKCAENVPLKAKGMIDGVEFTTGKTVGNSMMIDDILVYADCPLPQGYPSAPRTVTPDKNVKEVGMMMYSMWREGYHFGWDRLSPYEERTPYLGYYTEGDGESADWSIKWQKEHGVTYQIYTWSSVPRTEDGPIKRPTRSQVWMEGLREAQFDMDWCLMWSTPTDQTIRGLEDFKNNILPFWVEYAWKDPNYKRIDNKILLYTYDVYKTRDLLGGTEAMSEAIRLMNEEAKKLGADGVMFVACEGGNFSNEEATQLGMFKYTYGWGHGSNSDAEIVKSGITSRMESGNYHLYIPSIPMGFETSPWRNDGVGGFMTIKEMTDMLNYVNENAAKWAALGNRASDMVVLTCWDEFGEGHYYCPSETHGFEYMNAIRDTLTTKGKLIEEELPSKQSYARMNVLYPIGRQALKLNVDNRETEMPSLENGELTLIQKIDFSNPEDFARAEIEKSVTNLRQENGMLVFDCTGSDPSVFVNNLAVPADRVTYIKINGSQPVAGTHTLYYQTTDDMAMGKNYKRFTGAMSGGVMESAILYPADTKKLTGTITRMRIDPPDSAIGTMKVQSIEIYGSNTRKINVVADGKDYSPNTPIRSVNGTSFMSIYHYFHINEFVPCFWYRDESRLHIEYDGKVIEVYDGKNEFTIDGVAHTLSATPYYDDGNLFVPVKEFFGALGYNIGWDNDKYAVVLESPQYQDNQLLPADAIGIWSFNRTGDSAGWKPNWNSSGAVAKNGALEVSVLADPAVISQTTTFKAEDFNKLRIRVKNSSNATTMRFYYTSDTVKSVGSPNGVVMPISANDADFKEYVIDLKSVTGYGGTINMIRLDFVYGNQGTVYIDEIALEK